MNEVLIICLTCYVSLIFLTLMSAKMLREYWARTDKAVDAVARLDAAVAEYSASSAERAQAVLALSERVMTMELAMKAAIAQMVNVSGYTAEKHKALVAASVRGRNQPPAQKA